MDLTNNTFVITGGTSGIGRGLAEELDRLGSTVIICGRREDRLDAVRAERPRIITRRCDVADDDERRALAQWLTDEHPKFSVLVNNAGVQLTFDAREPVDLDRVRTELELNLIAPLHLSSLLAPHMAHRAGATIVNVSSGLAFVPLSIVGLYCASKAALHSLTMSLRHQYRPLGISVVELVPPAVDTELGADRRTDPEATHGGMPIAQFVAEALAGLAADDPEIMVGSTSHFRANPDEMYARMNP
jgi:uncharacterized oxidoreductase